INQALGLTSEGFQVTGGQTQTAFASRRRIYFSRRIKRDILNKILLIRIFEALNKTKTIYNITCQIVSRQYSLIFISLLFTFVGVSSTKPKGFGGEPKTLGQFIAINLGQFVDPSTWGDEIVPYGNCSIIITSSLVVTISKAFIDLNMRKCDIYGTLILGSSSYSSFTFGYRSNAIVHVSGSLQDQTSGNVINCPEGTLLTIYPMGSFVGKDAVVNSITTAQITANQTRSVKLSSNFNDPFTCGGCGMRIPTGFVLSAVDLNSELNMNFNDISIAVGTVFQLGSSDSNNGFKFKSQIRIDCHGTLVDITGGTGGISICF
ncbi:unnamed protein product, partial [Rotaria magnacalcarata]